MCGIAGIVQFNRVWNKGQLNRYLRAMAEAQAHRGPDDQGVWLSGCERVGFAHRRLSIIDLSPAGHQPMVSADGRFCITFNGEIYNYRELRRELERAGCRFRTRSDTEVVIEAYRHYGDACVEHFDGMFAFAIYDHEREQLFAARDAFGEKPFYYALVRGALIFGSELHVLTCVPEFDTDVSMDAISGYLALQYFDGEGTLYSQARKLPPGHTLTLTAESGVTVRRYFRFMPEPVAGTVDEDALVDELEQILLTNIERRLRADVPVGAFLSGGVDSSTVVALARRRLGVPIQTFSIGFKGWADSEHRDAEQMARHIGTDHHTELLDTDILSELDHVARCVDEPNADTSLLPTYLLSRLARRHVKVVLSGDGADEMFGGYTRYFATLAEEHSHLDRRTAGARYYSNRILIFSEDELCELMVRAPHACRLYLQSLREGVDQGPGSLIDRLRTTDIEHYLPGAVLAKVDRMSMRYGLEVRTPFLNLDMARFAQRLPESLLADGKGGKYLLKKLAQRYLPRDWLDRPKRGFGLPPYQWGGGRLFDEARTRLIENRDRRLWWLDPGRCSQWLSRHAQDKDALTYKLWTLLHLGEYLAHHPAAAQQETGVLRLRSLETKLGSVRGPYLFLARRFPASWRHLLTRGSCALSLWCQNEDTGIEYDWIRRPEGLGEQLTEAGFAMPATIILVDAEPDEARKLSEVLRGQGVKRILYFDDMEWVELRLSGLRSRFNVQSSGHAPFFFDKDTKFRIEYGWKTSLEELGQDMTASFSRVMRAARATETNELADRRGLLASDTPQRALRLVNEIIDWVGYSTHERRTREGIRTLLRQDYRRRDFCSNKVLFVLPGLYPGGAEKQACNLMIELSQRGYEVKLLTLGPLVGHSGHYAPMLAEHDIEVIYAAPGDADSLEFADDLPTACFDVLTSSVPFIRKYVLPLFRHIVEQRPASVVSFLDLANLSGGLAALLAGVPDVLVSFRNINPTHFNFYEAWYAPYYRLLIESPRLVMTGNSSAGNLSYAQWLGVSGGQVRLLPNGVDFSRCQVADESLVAGLRERMGISPSASVVGGIFRLSPEKRPQLFIDAVAEAGKICPGLVGFIVGDGPMRIELEEYISKQGLSDSVFLVGCVQDVAPYIGLADLMLQTSWAEGTANAVLEAQYLCKPVLVTAGGGSEESIADGVTGQVVPAHAREIAGAIDRLLGQPEQMREIGRQGRRFVQERFALDVAAGRLVSLLNYAQVASCKTLSGVKSR